MNTTLNRLVVLQNRAVRLMTLSPYRTSPGPIHKQLKLLQFNNIRKLQISVFMFKSKNKLLPKKKRNSLIAGLSDANELQ